MKMNILQGFRVYLNNTTKFIISNVRLPGETCFHCNKYDMIELSFNIIESIDIKDKSLIGGYCFGTLYILNKKYTNLRADTSVSSGISVYVDGREQTNAANALINCVNSLNSK